MAQVKETQLPGIGVRHEFTTKNGDRIGTITHRSGRRDLLLFDRRDPDACANTIRLEDEDADTLAEMLGASHVQQGQEKVRGEVGGLTLDWLPITATWSCSGCAIADTEIYEKTGVAIVAVMRHGEPIPTPDGNFRLRPDDVAIVVGSPEGIAKAQALLEGGPK
jgi:TrkA domain protein